MRRAWLLVPLLLAGCASPAPPDIIEVPLGEAPPAACETCSWEWWNVSVKAHGRWATRLPLPVAFGLPGPPRVSENALAWAGRVRLTGGTADIGASLEGAWVELSGEGDAAGGGMLARRAAPFETADAFLLARWGPGANDTRPTIIDAVGATGDVRSMRLTYEARSDLCWRRAAFDHAGDGVLPIRLAGTDEAGCA